MSILDQFSVDMFIYSLWHLLINSLIDWIIVKFELFCKSMEMLMWCAKNELLLLIQKIWGSVAWHPKKPAAKETAYYWALSHTLPHVSCDILMAQYLYVTL